MEGTEEHGRLIRADDQALELFRPLRCGQNDQALGTRGVRVSADAIGAQKSAELKVEKTQTTNDKHEEQPYDCIKHIKEVIPKLADKKIIRIFK